MKDKNTNQMLDQLADLYLTDTFSTTPQPDPQTTTSHTATPIKMAPKITSHQNTNKPNTTYPNTPQPTTQPKINLTLTTQSHDPHPPHHPRPLKFENNKIPESTHSSREPNTHSNPQAITPSKQNPSPATLQCIIAGNLPGYADGWISQYANHIAQQQQSLILMLHIDDHHIDLDLFAPAQTDLTPISHHYPTQGVSLNEILKQILNDTQYPIAALLIHNACTQPNPRQDIQTQCQHCTILTGCDLPARIAANTIAQKLQAQTPPPNLQFFIMGRIASDLQQAQDLFNQDQLEQNTQPISIAGSIEQMQPVNRLLLASFGNQPSQWPSIQQIVLDFQHPNPITTPSTNHTTTQLTTQQAPPQNSPQPTAQTTAPASPIPENGVLFEKTNQTQTPNQNQQQQYQKTNPAPTRQAMRDFGASVSALDDLLAQKINLDQELMHIAHNHRTQNNHDQTQILQFKEGKIVPQNQIDPALIAQGLHQGYQELAQNIIHPSDLSHPLQPPTNTAIHNNPNHTHHNTPTDHHNTPSNHNTPPQSTAPTSPITINASIHPNSTARPNIPTDTIMPNPSIGPIPPNTWPPITTPVDTIVTNAINLPTDTTRPNRTAPPNMTNHTHHTNPTNPTNSTAHTNHTIAPDYPNTTNPLDSTAHINSANPTTPPIAAAFAEKSPLTAPQTHFSPEPLCLTEILNNSPTIAGRAINLQARCPAYPEIQLSVDEAGQLHLLSQHDSRLRIDVPAMQLLEVRSWARKHTQLLALTQRQLRFDLSAEPILHLLTDQSLQAMKLIQSLGDQLKLHLLQSIQVNAHNTWVCNDLN